MAMKDYELAKISFAELLRPHFERLAEEEPETLAKMFPPEQIVKALTPEQIVKALTPEQIVKALTPEQIADILTSEELAKTLEALPPEIKEQIKQRLH